MCLWIRFDKDMDEYVNSLGLFFYWNSTSVVMMASTLVMLNCFLGCCGSYFSNRPTIIVYMIFHGHHLHHAAGRGCLHAGQRRSVDIIQEYVGCCGGYSHNDYTDIHLPVPNTCRDQVTGNQYSDSCAEIFGQYLEVRTGWLAGLSLSLCFFQCFAMMISVCMYMALKERDEDRRM
ncbi:hypothetical protein O3P69_016043 [Scylla paramamosain]|uniref:Tetraspanin n=1 Tax=Scylla paramamosain TaxID=85552 RepID=A0AAW0T8V9_SCYPA